MKKMVLRYFNDLFFTFFHGQKVLLHENYCGIRDYEKRCTLTGKNPLVCKTVVVDGR